MAFTFSRLLYAAVVNDRRCIMHFIALARSSATRPFTELGAQRSPVGHNRIECGTFPPGHFPARTIPPLFLRGVGSTFPPIATIMRQSI